MKEFERARDADQVNGVPVRERIRKIQRMGKLTWKEAKRVWRELDRAEVFVNGQYVVHVHRHPHVIHLSIRREDREAIHDWREMQEIKNKIVGPEHEAVEIYPPESQLVDGANQYHLWCGIEPGPVIPEIGFRGGRSVDYRGRVNAHGGKQRIKCE